MITIENIQFILTICALGGIVFTIYKSVREPDIKTDKQLGIIGEEFGKRDALCEMRHKNIDGNILMIKENHLKHMEKDIKDLNEKMATVITIIEERIPRKPIG